MARYASARALHTGPSLHPAFGEITGLRAGREEYSAQQTGGKKRHQAGIEIPARPHAEADARVRAAALRAHRNRAGAPEDRGTEQHERSADHAADQTGPGLRSEEHTSELQSLMRISYAVF